MIAACPKCGTRFKIDESRMPVGGVKLRCSRCRTVFGVRRKEATVKAESASRQMQGCRVVIAHSDPVLCDMVSDILKAEKIEAIKAHDGVYALELMEKERPDVAVLDVSLPMMYGFEVCEHIKGRTELKNIKVILMASIYDKTRYKRNPTSLYGADDYIEKHHIHDDLVPKINRLVFSTVPDAKPEEPMAPYEETVTSEVKQEHQSEKEIESLKSAEKAISEQDRAVEEKAKRLARVIVSDIALYSDELVTEGIKNNTIYTLLKDDINEGLEHFKKKVPLTVPAARYLNEAFEEFISKRKKEMGL